MQPWDEKEANSRGLDFLWGSFTVVFGILFYFIIPDDQEKAYFLNSRQKYIAVERLRSNQGETWPRSCAALYR
jgi:hypothetical protein